MKRRFIGLFTTIMVLMLLFCSCSTTQTISAETSTESPPPPAEIDVLVEGSKKYRLAINAKSSLKEALEDNSSVYFDPTGWGYDYMKVNVTITSNNQNIVSIKQQNGLQLKVGNVIGGAYAGATDSIEFVDNPGRMFTIEPWVDVKDTPTVILQITLEDNSIWYIAIHARGY